MGHQLQPAQAPIGVGFHFNINGGSGNGSGIANDSNTAASNALNGSGNGSGDGSSDSNNGDAIDSNMNGGNSSGDGSGFDLSQPTPSHIAASNAINADRRRTRFGQYSAIGVNYEVRKTNLF